jgi:hypothetical protein
MIGVVVTAEDVREIARSLPRSEEAVVRDRLKFRVRRIVYASLSTDETVLGFGFPKEERAALVATEPEVFMMPLGQDERYNWVRVRLDGIDRQRLSELLVDAWLMVVPKTVGQAYLSEERST